MVYTNALNIDLYCTAWVQNIEFGRTYHILLAFMHDFCVCIDKSHVYCKYKTMTPPLWKYPRYLTGVTDRCRSHDYRRRHLVNISGWCSVVYYCC